jgi:tryptophan-rich sensory protein
MENALSYVLANSYAAASPLMNLAAVCTVNGENVACPSFGPFAILTPLVFFALFVLMIISMWKIYTKAGKPGWTSIIPIYNMIVQLEIIGKPLWWIILLFIPFVNIIVAVMVAYEFAKVFGKGAGFTVGLIFLPFIFYPILAFGDATYKGPVAA